MSRSLVTAFASIAGSRILVIIASAVISPALVYFLTTGEFGQYGSVMAVFNLLMILVSSGINSGVRKYISEERDDDHWKDHVFAYYFRLATGLAALAAVSLALGAYTGVLSNLLNSDSNISTYFYLLAFLVVASQFREYVRRALMGLKFEHIGEPLRVIEKISFGVVAVTLAALDFGVVGVLFGLITASMLVFSVGLFFIAKEIRLSYVLKPLPDDFPRKEMFHFNHLTIVYVFLLTSMYHIDVIFVQSFIGSTEAGLYKMALVLVEFLWVIPRSIQSVMIQSTSNLWVEGKIEQIQEIAAKSTRYALLITMLLALGMGALAGDFVPLYYPSVETPETVVTAILLLLPGTLGFAMARPLLSINHAKGDMRSLIAATGAAAGINLVLNVLLIPGLGPVPELGTQGAAIATSIGYGSLPIFQVWVGRRFGYDPFADVRFPRLITTGLVAAVPIVGLTLLIDNSFVALLVVPPVGFVVYMATAIVTGSLPTGELLSLLGSLPEPFASKARAVERRLDGSGSLGGINSQSIFSVALPVVGIVFFAIGISFVAGVPGIPGLGGDDDSPATPGGNVTSPTPTQNGSLTDSPTATPTDDGATNTDDSTDEATPSPTATETETATETDDGGGLFGDGGLFGGDDSDDDDSDGTDAGDDAATDSDNADSGSTDDGDNSDGGSGSGDSDGTSTDSPPETPTDSPTDSPTDGTSTETTTENSPTDGTSTETTTENSPTDGTSTETTTENSPTDGTSTETTTENSPTESPTPTPSGTPTPSETPTATPATSQTTETATRTETSTSTQTSTETSTATPTSTQTSTETPTSNTTTDTSTAESTTATPTSVSDDTSTTEA